MGQQRGDELLLPGAAGFGLAHQAHRRIFVGLIAHDIQHRQHSRLDLRLLQRQRLLARLDLRVGQLLNFFEHLLRADTGRQLGDHQLPLATRQLLNLPAGPHFERATARAIRLQNIARRTDDLPATGVVWPRDDGQQIFIRKRWVFDHRHAGIRHFAQVMAGDFCGQAHRNAAGTVEQGKRQTRGQLAGLFGRAIVVGGEINRAFVDLVHQQAGDFGQARLGVAHRRSTIAIAAAKVALAIHQRVALRKILRHAHQRVVGRLVAMRVKATQHITHNTRTFDRLGRAISAGTAKAQAHARHRIKNAPLHWFQTVTHIGQRAAFDHAQRIFKVGPLRVGGEVQVRVIVRVVRDVLKEVGCRWFTH